MKRILSREESRAALVAGLRTGRGFPALYYAGVSCMVDAELRRTVDAAISAGVRLPTSRETRDAIADMARQGQLTPAEERWYRRYTPVLNDVPTSYRPKGTDEVGQVSDLPGDGELHGGDGNSGECDHAATSARDDAAEILAAMEDLDHESESAPEWEAEAPAEDGNPEPLQEASQPSATAEVQADDPEGEAEDEPDRAGARPNRDSAKQPGNAAPRDHNQDEDAGHSSDAAGETASPSRASHDQWGGVYAELELRPPTPGQQYARGLLRAFVERELGTRGAASPRIDARRLVRECVSRRYAVHRAQRHELDRRRVLVAVDVSGSCSASCGRALDAAYDLAAADERVVLATHSNGWCVAAVVGQQLRQYQNIALHEFVHPLRLASRILWLGDVDGLWTLRELIDAGHSCVWLDSECASYGDPQERPAPGGLRNTRYFRRCSTLQDFIYVLRRL